MLRHPLLITEKTLSRFDVGRLWENKYGDGAISTAHGADLYTSPRACVET